MRRSILLDASKPAPDSGENDFWDAFQPLQKAPALGRTNGIGSGLYGWLHDDRLGQAHIKIHFVSILWIPCIPLAGYVVEGFYNEFKFYRKISLFKLMRLYGLRVVPLYMSALIEGAGLMVLFLTLMGSIVVGVHYARGMLN